MGHYEIAPGWTQHVDIPAGFANAQPSRAIFIDDLAQHIASSAEVTPEVIRLHLCGEPLLAPHIPCAYVAGHAHARIDSWDAALPWLLAQLTPIQEPV